MSVQHFVFRPGTLGYLIQSHLPTLRVDSIDDLVDAIEDYYRPIVRNAADEAAHAAALEFGEWVI